MDELGVDSRLDETHFTEYTQESFKHEANLAGLDIVSMQIQWGEIWCEAKVKEKDESMSKQLRE